MAKETDFIVVNGEKMTIKAWKESVVAKQKDIYIWIPNFLILNNTALNFAKKQKGGQ